MRSPVLRIRFQFYGLMLCTILFLSPLAFGNIKAEDAAVRDLVSKYDQLLTTTQPEALIKEIYQENADYFMDYLQGHRKISASREKIKRWFMRIKGGLSDRKVLSCEITIRDTKATVVEKVSLNADLFGGRINQEITLKLTRTGSKWQIASEKIQVSLGENEDAAAPVAAVDETSPFFEAAEYSRTHGGLSMLVMKEGKTVFEAYHNGHSAEKPHRLASGTKSFVGVLAMMAVEDGLFQLDDRASDTLSEWRSDPRKRDITIRQLLQLTSGLAPSANVLRGPKIDNKYQWAVSIDLISKPGELFAYGPSHFFAFGELLKRKLAPRGETVRQYLYRRLLTPIGLKPKYWSNDRSGNIQLPFGAMLTARQWAVFGEFIRRQGNWDDQMLLAPHLLSECFIGSAANPIYGLTFWLSPTSIDTLSEARKARINIQNQAQRRMALNQESPRIEVDYIMAAGAGKQRLYIIHSGAFVVVRQGRKSSPPFKDNEFLHLLMKNQGSK